jgi:Arc/MetJ-type ribon-helix-helix transcriptional regulator
MRSTSKSKPGPGRPPVHRESWSKVSVVLFDRQIHHLDRLGGDRTVRNGRFLNRAEIIRALIDGLIDSGMDITTSGSEADLRARVARRLGTPYR